MPVDALVLRFERVLWGALVGGPVQGLDRGVGAADEVLAESVEAVVCGEEGGGERLDRKGKGRVCRGGGRRGKKERKEEDVPRCMIGGTAVGSW